MPDAVNSATIEQRIRHPPTASSAAWPPITVPPARTVATAPQRMLMINKSVSQTTGPGAVKLRSPQGITYHAEQLISLLRLVGGDGVEA